MSKKNQNIKDILYKFTDYANQVIDSAFGYAREEGECEVLPRHLFMGILENKRNLGARVLNRLGVDISSTLDSLVVSDNDLKKDESRDIVLGKETKSILVDAFIISSDMRHVYVGSEHILLSILKLENLKLVKDLLKAGIDYSKVLDFLLNYATYNNSIFQNDEEDEELGGASKMLNMYAEDMNLSASEGRYLPIFGRNDEINRLIHILSRKTKSNPILVGEAGVGKTAIVEGFVQRILEGSVPSSFQNSKVVSLDLAGILAGSKIRGDVEERITMIIKEAAENDDIILFIDEIHMIIGAGSAGTGTMDIANILKPYLTGGRISVIGATTGDEYQKYFETDSALTRRFQKINVEEIGRAEVVRVLQNIRPRLENFHRVRITDSAIQEAVLLSDRYITDRFFPDKAIDVLDETSAMQKIAKESDFRGYVKLKRDYEKLQADKNEALEKNDIEGAANLRSKEVKVKTKLDKLKKQSAKISTKKFVVDRDRVRFVVANLTKIPVENLKEEETKNLVMLQKSLEGSIVGQSEATSRVASALKRARVGISEHGKPLGSFLFLGPTGVGKSELAKTVAKELFGSDSAIIQVDMSEYMEQHSVSKLIGSPPGYVGFQEGGQLTEKVRRQPYAVILFDEIEKAHPDLLNILLQVLDEGSLKDSKGRIVNFKNTIVIMTSNIGAEEISKDEILGFNVDSDESNDPSQEVLEKAFDEIKERLFKELKNELRPELLNRIDDIIVFRALDDKSIRKITKKEIEKLNERLSQKNIKVNLTNGAIKFIAEEGFDEEYGARNIKRKIQELVENPLADFLLERGMVDFDRKKHVVKVEKRGDGLAIQEVSV